MFRNTFQSGFLSILFSVGTKPLQIWDKKVRNGYIKRITDNEIQSLVLELLGSNVSNTYISCPADPRKALGIKLPFLVLIVKNSISTLRLKSSVADFTKRAYGTNFVEVLRVQIHANCRIRRIYFCDRLFGRRAPCRVQIMPSCSNMLSSESSMPVSSYDCF
ncbi:unnamed protein product [Schistosoma haematobium]|nr:unnamed protein product [Schistosoma haematobium]